MEVCKFPEQMTALCWISYAGEVVEVLSQTGPLVMTLCAEELCSCRTVHTTPGHLLIVGNLFGVLTAAQ